MEPGAVANCRAHRTRQTQLPLGKDVHRNYANTRMIAKTSEPRLAGESVLRQPCEVRLVVRVPSRTRAERCGTDLCRAFGPEFILYHVATPLTGVLLPEILRARGRLNLAPRCNLQAVLNALDTLGILDHSFGFGSLLFRIHGATKGHKIVYHIHIDLSFRSCGVAD